LPIYGGSVGSAYTPAVNHVAAYQPTSSYAPKKKKHNILYNFFSDLGDLRYMPMGIAKQAASTWSDVAHVAEKATGSDWSFDDSMRSWAGADGEWAADDLLGGIVDDYKYVYGPATHGDFKTTWDRISDHPLGPVLDVLTVATLGAGAASKGVQFAAKTGTLAKYAGDARAASMLEKVAGLEKVTYDSQLPKKFDWEAGRYVKDQHAKHVDDGADLPETDLAQGYYPETTSAIQSRTASGPRYQRGVVAKGMKDENGMDQLFRPRQVKRSYNTPSGKKENYVDAHNNPFKRLLREGFTLHGVKIPGTYTMGGLKGLQKLPGGNERYERKRIIRERNQYTRQQHKLRVQAQPHIAAAVGVNPSVIGSLWGHLTGAADIDEKRKFYQGQRDLIDNPEELGMTQEEFDADRAASAQAAADGTEHDSQIDIARAAAYKRKQEELSQLQQYIRRNNQGAGELVLHGDETLLANHLKHAETIDKHSSDLRSVAVDIDEAESYLDHVNAQLDVSFSDKAKIPWLAEKKRAEDLLAIHEAKARAIEESSGITRGMLKNDEQAHAIAAKLGWSPVKDFPDDIAENISILADQMDGLREWLHLHHVDAEKNINNPEFYAGALDTRIAELNNPVLRSVEAAMRGDWDKARAVIEEVKQAGGPDSDALIAEIEHAIKEENIKLVKAGMLHWQKLADETNLIVRELYGNNPDHPSYRDNSSKIARLQEELASGEADPERTVKIQEEISSYLNPHERGIAEQMIFHGDEDALHPAEKARLAEQLNEPMYAPARAEDITGSFEDGIDPNKLVDEEADARVRESELASLPQHPAIEADRAIEERQRAMFEGVDNPYATYESDPLSGLGLGKVYRSHKIREDLDTRKSGRDKNNTSARHQKKTEYITVRNALDAVDLPSIERAQKEALAARVARHRLNQLAKHTHSWKNGQAVPMGYEVIMTKSLHDPVRKAANAILERMHSDLNIIFDPDETPYMQSTIDYFESLLDTGDGDMLIAPKAIKHDIVQEVTHVAKFLQKFFDQPQRFWRAFTLGYRPAWAVNQAVGNMFLLYATHGVLKATRGIMHYTFKKEDREYLTQLLDERAPDATANGEIRSLLDMAPDDNTPVAEATVWREKLGNALENFYGKRVGPDGGDKFGGFLKGGVPVGPEAWMTSVARVIDDPARRISFAVSMRGPVKDLMARTKAATGNQLSYREAAEQLLADDQFFDHMVTEVLDDMVNFRDMSEAERRYIRPFIPFYSWLSGISRRTVRMLNEQPGTLAYINYTSQQGRESLESMWGDVQDFIMTYLPLGVPGNKEKILAFKTAGMNPMSTISDLAGAAKALVGEGDWKGSENPMSTLNPVVKSFIEAMTGTDMFYNNTLEDYRPAKFENGVASGGDPNASKAVVFGKRLGLSIPQVNSIYRAMQPEKPNDQTPGKRYAAYNYLGVPTVSVNIAEARRRGSDETLREFKKELAAQRAAELEAAYNG
jgi:hypothetical protein